MIRNSSLKTRLLMLLLPTLLVVAGIGVWLTRQNAVEAANSAYDRSLLGAIKALDLNVSTASGGLSVELPYRLFEFFELTATGSVYFRVATEDDLVEIGSPDLPLPPRPPTLGAPVFYDADYFGESLRLGAYLRPLEQTLGDSEARNLIIQVAESTSSRRHFIASFVLAAVYRDALLLALTLAIVVALLSLALRPLSRLSSQTRSRDAKDLRPLDTHGLPSDVEPLVGAINGQLRRTEELMHQQRIFLDDASHQLRTPLTTMRAQLDYAIRETDADQAHLAVLAASTELDHAARGVNQLLALARSDATLAQRESFDLAELAREVAVGLLPLARAHHVDLGLDIVADPCRVSGDRAMLREGLTNLAHNAIVHGRRGGEVTIEVGAVDACWRLAVVDDGPGLPPELGDRAGQRFAKGPRSRGAGLGIAIARSVVERHSGRLVLSAGADGRGLRASMEWTDT